MRDHDSLVHDPSGRANDGGAVGQRRAGRYDIIEEYDLRAIERLSRPAETARGANRALRSAPLRVAARLNEEIKNARSVRCRGHRCEQGAPVETALVFPRGSRWNWGEDHLAADEWK